MSCNPTLERWLQNLGHKMPQELAACITGLASHLHRSYAELGLEPAWGDSVARSVMLALPAHPKLPPVLLAFLNATEDGLIESPVSEDLLMDEARAHMTAYRRSQKFSTSPDIPVCGPDVQALHVVEVTVLDTGNHRLDVLGYPSFEVPKAWASVHAPAAGGYYLIHENRHASFVDAPTFERTYL